MELISRYTCFQGADPRLNPDTIQKILYDLDQYSVRQFLHDHAFLEGHALSEGARDMICAILLLEMQLSSSMAATVNLEIELHAEHFKQINGGMDYLPKAFLGKSSLPDASRKEIDEREELQRQRGEPPIVLPGLGADITYNARVIEISNVPPRLFIHWRNTITNYDNVNENFDIAVIAVPFSALRHIRMLGLTTPRKRRAIRQLHYANACKILLEFRHKFWCDSLPEQLPIEGGSSITDLAIRYICYPNNEQNNDPHGRGVILASYTWGDDSIRWTSLSHNDRIRLAIRDLERVHGRDKDRLYPVCIGGMSHSWAEDEFTSGAFAQFEPYQRIHLFKDVWRPEPPIHYCGEHTSTKHGWIEGAIESGIRVAAEIEGLPIRP
jgi:monoamine oxidase